jgi:hypothetical protein
LLIYLTLNVPARTKGAGENVLIHQREHAATWKLMSYFGFTKSSALYLFESAIMNIFNGCKSIHISIIFVNKDPRVDLHDFMACLHASMLLRTI